VNQRHPGIFVQFPTRGRLDRFMRTLETLFFRANHKDRLRVHVVTDLDDQDMRGVGQANLPREWRDQVTFYQKPPTNKIDACNWNIRVIEKHPGCPCGVFVLVSDDMEPQPGWDTMIDDAFARLAPDFDAALQVSDGVRSDILTVPIYGFRYARRLLDETFSRIVYPRGYRSLYADDEATLIASRLGKLVDATDIRPFIHLHPAWGRGENDDLYKRNDLPAMADMVLFEGRRRGDITSHLAPRLSILVPGVQDSGDRDIMRQALVDELLDQCDHLDCPNLVEVRLDVDAGLHRGGASIGDKRQRMLRGAAGRYVAFVDDDDAVHPQYVRRLVEAIQQHQPDVVTFNVPRMVRVPECRGLPGLQGWEWDRIYRLDATKSEDGPDWRLPNHLCAVRRDLALQAGYQSEAYGEDAAYARRLLPLISKYHHIGGEPMYYYLDDSGRSITQRPRVLQVITAPAEAGRA
jgi:hypothetical protein